MSKHATKIVPINEPITILGHPFQSLKEIRDAVEATSSVGHGKMKGNRFVGWDALHIHPSTYDPDSRRSRTRNTSALSLLRFKRLRL